MNEPERRTRGIIRISMHSIIKLLFGENSNYEAISMRVCKYDKSILNVTVSHPTLPEWTPGKRLKEIKIERRYEQTEE
jgi:hypothetical protein